MPVADERLDRTRLAEMPSPSFTEDVEIVAETPDAVAPTVAYVLTTGTELKSCFKDSAHSST